MQVIEQQYFISVFAKPQNVKRNQKTHEQILDYMTNYLFTFSILIATMFKSIGQGTNKSVFLNVGLNFLNNKETHYTSNFRNGIGYNILIGYEYKTQNSINNISLTFLNAKTGNGNISTSNLLQPELIYEYLRTIPKSGISIGGYLDFGSLLNFRSGKWAAENSTNYTIWSSLGLSTQYQKAVNIGTQKLNWNTRFSIPAFSYLIRPSYTFPYTDNYLQNNVFEFDRTGLGSRILTGGRFAFLDKFLKTQFQTGFTIPTKNNKWELGLNYVFDYLQTNELKPVFQFGHQLNLTTKFIK